jgi:hypothetical protein
MARLGKSLSRFIGEMSPNRGKKKAFFWEGMDKKYFEKIIC